MWMMDTLYGDECAASPEGEDDIDEQGDEGGQLLITEVDITDEVEGSENGNLGGRRP